MSAPSVRRPGVGLGIFVLRGGKFVMLRRHGSHGAGEWSLVGGAVEWGETITEAALRETREEIGIELDPASLRIGPVTNDLDPTASVHFVGVYVSASPLGGADPRIMEPGKATDIGWFDLGSLPQPLFGPMRVFGKIGAAPPFLQPDLPPSL